MWSSCLSLLSGEKTGVRPSHLASLVFLFEMKYLWILDNLTVKGDSVILGIAYKAVTLDKM